METICRLDAAERSKRLYVDPVYFCLNIIPDYFDQDYRFELLGEQSFRPDGKWLEPSKGSDCFMPWLHRGVMAILLRRCTWLNDYGELTKIVRNFRWNIGDEHEPSWVYIFRLTPEGRIVFNVKYDNIQIMMPRGSSKTTTVKAAQVIKTSWKIVDFSLLVSASEGHMVSQLSHIKSTIVNNERFISLFGELRPQLRSTKTWQDSQVDLLNGTHISAKGRESKMRGMLREGKRPREIILDDYEDEISVNTSEQLEKARSRFFKVVKPMLPRISRKGQWPPTIVVVNTLLAMESLSGDFIKDPDYVTIRFGVLDVDGEPWWPEWMDKAAYEAEKDKWALAGRSVEFHLEYDNTEIPSEARKFKKENFYYRRLPHGVAHVSFTVCDPAISPKRKSDNCSICTVSLTRTGYFFVRESIDLKGPDKQPDIICENIMRQVTQYNSRVVGVENNGFQAALNWMLNELFRRNHIAAQIEGITNQNKKEERVELALQPRYKQGYIIHERRFPDLEAQLLDWPLSKKDAPDALAMAVSLAVKHVQHLLIPADNQGEEQQDLNQLLGDWRLV